MSSAIKRFTSELDGDISVFFGVVFVAREGDDIFIGFDHGFSLNDLAAL